MSDTSSTSKINTCHVVARAFIQMADDLKRRAYATEDVQQMNRLLHPLDSCRPPRPLSPSGDDVYRAIFNVATAALDVGIRHIPHIYSIDSVREPLSTDGAIFFERVTKLLWLAIVDPPFLTRAATNRTVLHGVTTLYKLSFFEGQMKEVCGLMSDVVNAVMGLGVGQELLEGMSSVTEEEADVVMRNVYQAFEMRIVDPSTWNMMCLAHRITSAYSIKGRRMLPCMRQGWPQLCLYLREAYDIPAIGHRDQQLHANTRLASLSILYCLTLDDRGIFRQALSHDICSFLLKVGAENAESASISRKLLEVAKQHSIHVDVITTLFHNMSKADSQSSLFYRDGNATAISEDWKATFKLVKERYDFFKSVMYEQCSNIMRPIHEKTTLRACTGCFYASYCSRLCQKEHWKNGHKADCCIGSVPQSNYIGAWSLLQLLIHQEKLVDMISRLRHGRRLDELQPGMSRLAFTLTRNGEVITKNFSVGLRLTTGMPVWDLRASRRQEDIGDGYHELVVEFTDNGESRTIYRTIDSYALVY